MVQGLAVYIINQMTYTVALYNTVAWQKCTGHKPPGGTRTFKKF